MFKFIFFILNTLYFIGYPIIGVSGEFRHFIWTMQTPVAMADLNINYNDSTTSTYGVMDGGLNGTHTGINVYRNCKGNNNSLNATQEKTAWLIIQDKVYAGSVPITIGMYSTNGWFYPGQAQLPGYISRVNQLSVSTQLDQCFQAGAFPGVDFYWKKAEVSVSMSSGNLPPGVYRIPVNYYYAFEENKFTDANDKGPPNDVPKLIVGGLGTRGTFILNITVKSKCDFNNNPLKSTHDITLGDSSSYSSELASYSISCGASTPVKLELLGATKIPGKNNNFTKCGDSECELKFKDGTAISDGQIMGKKDFVINSTFHPTDKTKAGTFQGSGILRVTIK